MLISRDNHIYYFNVHYLILNNKMKFVVVNVQIITIYHKHSSVSPTIYTLNNTSPHGATPHDRENQVIITCILLISETPYYIPV
jgi:hypothetical protein